LEFGVQLIIIIAGKLKKKSFISQGFDTQITVHI